MNDEERFASWQRWIERLRPVVSYLLESRALWRDLRPRMLIQHPEFGRAPLLLYAWYVDSTIIQVRRLVDLNDRTWSLMLLLRSLQEHAETVTLDLLAEMTGHRRGGGWNLAEIALGDRSASPPTRLTGEAVERDIRRLSEATQRVVRIGHGYVAHLDKKPMEPESEINEEELSNIDETIKEVYLRYRGLLLASELNFSIETAAIGWESFVERVGRPLASEGGAPS